MLPMDIHPDRICPRYAFQLDHLSVRLPAGHPSAVLPTGALFHTGGSVVVGGCVAVFLRLVESALPNPPQYIHNFQLWRRISAAIPRTIYGFAFAQESRPWTGPGFQSRL